MFSLRKLSLACLCALFVAFARPSAQTPASGPPGVQQPPGTRLLDAYGNIVCEDLVARLDHLYVMLSNERDADAYVFVYGDRVKVERRVQLHIEFTKYYLTVGRDTDVTRRLHIIYGGRREEFAVEIFLAQKGSPPPKPAPTIDAPEDPRAARKFDENCIGFDRDAKGRPALWNVTEWSCPMHLPPDLGEYARALRAEPDSKAHVIVYGERGRRLSDSNTVSRLIRHRLFTAERIPHRRITVVYGGTRYKQYVELWIVPRGARLPTPTRD